VYIIDVAQHLLQSDIRVDQETQTLASQYIWRSGDEESVSAFLEQQISTTTALLKLRDGVVAPVPSLEDAYFKAIPMGPVSRFSDTILTQIRRTAAFSVLSLKNVASPSPETDSFRRRLARVAAQFDDDDHWETYAARAFSYHVDGQYEHAVEQYDRALDIIERDPNTDGLLEWESRVLELQRDREKAERGQDL
jgi:tetratricopeptide (TPR) repeat protein